MAAHHCHPRQGGTVPSSMLGLHHPGTTMTAMSPSIHMSPSPAMLAQSGGQFKQQRVTFQQKFMSDWTGKISSCGGNSKRLWS